VVTLSLVINPHWLSLLGQHSAVFADAARTHAALYDRDAKFRQGRKKQMKESMEDSSLVQTRQA